MVKQIAKLIREFNPGGRNGCHHCGGHIDFSEDGGEVEQLAERIIGLIVQRGAGERVRRPGAIYVGKCLTSHEPALWFCYVLLSRDREDDGHDYWTAAKFSGGVLGAQVEKFSDEDIEKLGYVGHITDGLSQPRKD